MSKLAAVKTDNQGGSRGQTGTRNPFSSQHFFKAQQLDWLIQCDKEDYKFSSFYNFPVSANSLHRKDSQNIPDWTPKRYLKNLMVQAACMKPVKVADINRFLSSKQEGISVEYQLPACGFADLYGYTVNTLEQVWGRGGFLNGEVQVNKLELWTWLGAGPGGPCMLRARGPCIWEIPVEQIDRHYWKHYFPATSLAGGNKGKPATIWSRTLLFTRSLVLNQFFLVLQNNVR